MKLTSIQRLMHIANFTHRREVENIGVLDFLFNRHKELGEMLDLEYVVEIEQRTYLKELAIETCSNFIARSVSQTEFKHMQGKKRLLDSELDRIFNIRPNTDESASDFWQTVINKLIRENEVLIIPYEKQLLVADGFHRVERALYPDTFEQVSIKEFTFTNKKWNMDEVIYLTYNNAHLSKFLDGLTNDYADLFGSLIDASKRGYQIRGSFSFDTINDPKNIDKPKDVIRRTLDVVNKSMVAVFPIFKNSTYTEYADGSKSGPSIDESEKVKRALIDNVANILGIPVNLIHGDVAELEDAMKAYVKFCLGPLLKKIEDELNAKIKLGKDEKIQLRGIAIHDVIQNSEAVDKLIASGAFSRNEVRELFGMDRVDDPELDVYVLTKNYEKVDTNTTKGGESQ